jgi:eukaryotic-like serine/threonine-protein kinase
MKGGARISAAVETRLRAKVSATISDKYRLDALLGIGGMASVFSATHRNGSRVALKILHPELSERVDVRTRFLREGYAANTVGHPGVVRVHDDGDDGEGNVFLVMELLEGETLQTRWETAGKQLPLGAVLGWMEELLGVLVEAHAHGIVHRDIKPENLFLTTEGQLKVFDFGIARLLDGTGATRSGELLGTPAFMAPEQAGGRTREVDGLSDIWSVGATMFTLLSGQLVHDHSNVLVQMVYAASESARSIKTVAPDLPHEIVVLVDTALQYERARRWKSAAHMLAMLRLARAATQPKAVPPKNDDAGGADTLPLPGREARQSANPTLPMGSAHQPTPPKGRE